MKELVDTGSHYDEWLDIIYEPGLCGLDYDDVADTLEGNAGELVQITARNISELDIELSKELHHGLKGVVAAIKLPGKCGLDSVRMIGQHIYSYMGNDADIIWQARNHTEDYIAVLLLKVM